MAIFLQIFMLALIVVMLGSVVSFILVLIEDGEFSVLSLSVLMVSIIIFILTYEMLKFNVSIDYNTGNSYSNNLKLEYTVKNKVENNYNEDEFNLMCEIISKIEDTVFWTDNYRVSYDNVRVYVDKLDDKVKITYTCTETMRKTGLFTVKVKKEVYNTIQVSDTKKDTKQNCPNKNDNDNSIDSDNDDNSKIKEIELKKE